MLHNTLTFVAFFLAFVMCCIFGYLVSLGFEYMIIIYLLIILVFFLYSVCFIIDPSLKQYEHYILVFFFVVQVIAYGTVFSMIIEKIWKTVEDIKEGLEEGVQLIYPIMLLLSTGLLLCCTLVLLYKILDNIDNVLQQEADEEMNFERRDYKRDYI